MPEETGAVFNEVLAIQIDLTKFQEQMDQVAAIYASTFESMPDLADMGQMASANAFTQAAAQIAAAAESIEREVMQMRIKVAESMLAAADASEAYAGRVEISSAAAAAAYARLGESAKRGADAERTAQDVKDQALVKRMAGIQAQAEAEDKAADRAERSRRAAEDSARDTERVRNEDRGTNAPVMLGPQTEEDFNKERDAADREERRRRNTEDQAREQNRRLNEDRGSGNVMLGPETKEQFDKAALEEQREGMKRAGEMNAAYAEDAKRAEEATKGVSSSIREFGSGIGGILVQMAQFAIAIAAIGAAYKLITFPIEIVKGGVEYLKSTQELASQVNATLLQTSSFSNDPAKNLTLAAQEATRLAKGIQDIGTQLNITAPQIKAAFDMFLTRGGGNLTGNLDESLGVTKLVTAGLQLTTPKEQMPRITASEMTKLVEGTVTASSKLPAIFGTSAAELNKISAEARTSQDLFERLSELSLGLNTRLAQSGDRMQSLANYAEILWQRFEAGLSGDFQSGMVGFFKVIVGYLQDMVDWTEKNKVAIDAWMKILTDGLTGLTTGIAGLLKTDWSVFIQGLKFVASLFATTAFSVGVVVAALEKAAALKQLVDNSPEESSLIKQSNELPNSDPRKQQLLDSADGLMRERQNAAKQQLADTQSAFDTLKSNYLQLEGRIAEYDPNSYGKVYGPPSPPPKSTPKNSIDLGADKSGLGLGAKEYKDEVDLIDNTTKNFVATQKELLAEHKVNQADTTKRILAALQEEDDGFKLLTAHRREQINNDPNSTSAQKQSALDTLSKTERDHEEKNSAEVKAARAAAGKETIDAAEMVAKEKLRIAEEEAKAEISLIKQQEKDGLLTRQQAEAALNAEEANRHTRATQVIAAMPNITEGDQARRNVADLQEQERAQVALREAKQRDVNDSIADAAAQAKYAESLLKGKEAILATNLEHAKSLNNKRAELAISKELIAVEIQLAEARLHTASENAARTVTGTDENLKAREELAAAKELIRKLQQELNDKGYSNSPIGQIEEANDNGAASDQNSTALEHMGVNLTALTQDVDNANNVFEKLGAVLSDAVIPFLTQFGESLSTAYNDLKKGNVGGAIGSASKAAGGAAGAAGQLADSLSNSSGDIADSIGNALGNASSSIPLIGGMISGMFSAITGFFTTSIQNMVTDLQDQIQNINLEASTKQIGIQTQIAELKQAEQTAISELGGKKKAQSQLQSILQSLNQQITTLQYQASQTVQQFNDMVAAANGVSTAGQSVAEQWLSTWQGINQQVEAYVQAGGSITTAAAYMNQQLQQQQMQLTDQLNQGNQQAIQDALQLNQLEQSKVEMMQKEAQTEFGLLNSDSLERNVASAVATGQQLTQQREAYAQQLQNMNFQISTAQLQVTANQQIFNLASSTAALQAQSNALTLAALNEQLQKYQEMQAILQATSGLTFTPTSINPGAGLNGTQAPIPGEPNVNGQATIGTINVTINGDATTSNVASLGAAIASNMRSGRTTFAIPGA